MRANSALTSPFSLFALSYGLERHAARCPRTAQFLNPGGVLLQRSGEPRGRRRRLGLSQRVPSDPRTRSRFMQLTHDQISTQAMEPQPARSAATRGRTCVRRATPLSLYSGIRHDESQSPLPLYTSLTGPGREVFVIETNGPGDPVSTTKDTTAAQSARPLLLFPMALQTWVVLSASIRGGLP